MHSKIAEENFKNWNDVLKAEDAKKVSELYSPDATFLPTLSGEFKKEQMSIEEYFQNFLKKHPVGEIINEEVQTLSPKSYLHSGLYNFELDEGEGRKTVEARFTFAWTQDEKGQWKIVHHHSSLRPREDK